MPGKNRRIAICFAIMTLSVVAIVAHSMRAEAASSGGAGLTTAGDTAPAGRAPTARDLAPRRGYFLGGRRTPTYTVPPSTAPTTVELVRVDDEAVARTWTVAVSSSATTIRWNGLLDGEPAPADSYRFRIGTSPAADTPGAAGVATAPPARAARGGFRFSDNLFPIRGKHDLGQTQTNNFGGGRNHQGQDMFARCGVPLAAAQGGVVKRAGTGAREGNYVVISGRSGDDYVYMHMNAAPLVSTGQKVFTGQAIGAVGDTGNASGCHLHFELWTDPGWYSGGSAINAISQLRAWDAAG